MNLENSFDIKHFVVKPVANALIAGGVAYMMGDLDEINLPLLGNISAYTGIGIASGIGSLVAQPLKSFVVPLMEHNQYLQKLEGSVLDLGLAGLSTLAVLAFTNGVPFNFKTMGYLVGYGVVGSMASDYVVNHFM